MADDRPMRIEGIGIRNYRQFKHIDVNNLPSMTVLVGANGSGKSVLFDVFTFLKDALAGNVAAVVARRGGFGELVSREQDGPIEITVNFQGSGGRLVTYLMRIGLEGGRPSVLREMLSYGREQRGETWQLVDFSKGKAGPSRTSRPMARKARSRSARNMPWKTPASWPSRA